ncbi:MAG: prenyltransferase/squalene oxidase repeat-containing protein [Phycisphaerae bacterium]|nr:prenyltransferase/squalene oxidase repeat-containing protein [Tepidisphaeraceae bacterium]
MITRRNLLTSLAAATVLPSGAILAADKPAAENATAKKIGIAAQPNQVRGDEITPAARAAIEKGLAFLASRQARNGSWSEGSSGAGITGLAGLALMSGGSLPGRGKYGDHVTKAVTYICNATQESGLIAADNSHGPMYGHGFATLFLGEVYGMTQDDDVKEKLQKAVRLIQKTQNKEGGWRYQPVPYDADISVTIAEVMALRAARDAGIKVEKEVIDKAIGYVKRCQCGDGGFSYVAGQGSGSGFARSGAGVAALYYGGVFEGNDLKRGLDYLMQFLPGRGASDSEGHYFYGHYYTVQAMFLAGGDYWAKWYPAIRDQLIARQNRTHGGWSGDVTDEYATALALIILQMPHRYLPVFHGKGPGA